MNLKFEAKIGPYRTYSLVILLILERLLHTLIFSSILTQMDDFTRKSMINGTISTSQLSISHFSAVAYPLPLFWCLLISIDMLFSCMFTLYGLHIQECAPNAETAPTKQKVEIDNEGRLKTKLSDKRDAFSFSIENIS